MIVVVAAVGVRIVELIGTRGAWEKWMWSQRGHPQSDLSKFGLPFMQYFIGVIQVVQADRSFLIIELRPCRPRMTHCLTLDGWG